MTEDETETCYFTAMHLLNVVDYA